MTQHPTLLLTRTLAACTLAALSCVGAHAQAPAARTYSPGSFEGIDISGSAVVRFTQGAVDQVVIEGDDDVQQAVELDVRGGNLSLHSVDSWKFWNARRLHVTVTARTLKRVSISGAADFTASGPVQTERLSIAISGAGSARFDQLQAEGLQFQVSGSGDGRFAGSVEDLRIAVSGKGNLDAGGLRSERAKVAISGVGSVGVWVTQDLTVAIAGVGTVDYWGNPRVRRSISGKGTLNDRGDKPGK